MDLVKEIEKAKLLRAKLDVERTALWKELDASLKEQEPMRKVERKIRAKIKAIQADMFGLDNGLSAAMKAAKTPNA